MSAETLAAIVGSVVGGIIAAVIQTVSSVLEARRRAAERRETRKALGFSLLFKLIKISSHLDQLKRFVALCFQEAEEARMQCEPWGILKPLGVGMDEVRFAPEEMSLLLSLGDDVLFNRMAVLDEIHNNTLGLFAAHRRLHEDLKERLPVPALRGSIGTTTFTPEQHARLAPRMLELNELVTETQRRCNLDASDASRALFDLHRLLTEKLDPSFCLQRKTVGLNLQSDPHVRR